jgi:glycosyltransferase involved in cell wall biosynthesis
LAVTQKIAIVIPAYNEERTIVSVLRGLKEAGLSDFIVVDDSSTDHTGELALQEGATVVRHVINRGLGGALGTGIRAALRFQPSIIVTFDADGQHDPQDVLPIIAPIEKGEADVVIGSRMLQPLGMPWSRRIANGIANLATRTLFGIRTTDSQSGLRAFSRQAARQLRITTSGMEVSSELAAEVARNQLRMAEVPITVIYTEYSLSKGQGLTVGMRTLGKLILAKIRRMAP